MRFWVARIGSIPDGPGANSPNIRSTMDYAHTLQPLQSSSQKKRTPAR